MQPFLPQRLEEDAFHIKADAEARCSLAHPAAGRRAEPMGRPGAGSCPLCLVPRPHRAPGPRPVTADVPAGEPWGAGPGVLTAGNGVTAGCFRQDPLMFEAKYFRGDTAGGFASTKKGVFSWRNRSVVIVGEEGGTPHPRQDPCPRLCWKGQEQDKP